MEKHTMYFVSLCTAVIGIVAVVCIGVWYLYFSSGHIHDAAIAAKSRGDQFRDASQHVPHKYYGIKDPREDEYTAKAIEAYTTALQYDPQYADAYYQRGRLYLGEADLDQAMADYNAALRLKPQFAEAYAERGRVYEERGRRYNNKGQLEQALADENEALRINPQFANAYFHIGEICEELGHKAEAIAAYRQCLHYGAQEDIHVFIAKHRLSALGG